MASMTETRSSERITRGERTKATIIDAALELFEERGYDATTMRAIAERAGVSVGNAYYYFDSKEQLVQSFYDRAATEHLAASTERLAGVSDLSRRIAIHLESWFDVMSRYHEFAAEFFRTAADPRSPMSPFSADSSAARDQAIERWRVVVDEAEGSVPAELGDELPGVLWLYQMGVILFWVHDSSAEQVATRLAIARTVPLIVRVIGLADVPELRATIEDLMALLRDARALLDATAAD